MIEYFVKKEFFKNANHAIWFISSISLFTYTTLTRWTNIGRFILLLPIIFHISAVLLATKKIHFKKEYSEIYSKDCIWWNSLMVVVYLVLMKFY